MAFPEKTRCRVQHFVYCPCGQSRVPIEVYRFFRDELETEFIQFIPIIERATEGFAASQHGLE